MPYRQRWQPWRPALAVTLAAMAALLARLAHAQVEPAPPGLLAERGENFRESLLCEYGCVDDTQGVLLNWCAKHVTYTFCNRTTYGPWPISVMKTEDGAINAYMKLIRELGGSSNDMCKASVRAWMCHEFFLSCTPNGRRVYKVCTSSCMTAYTLCGQPAWLRCDLEEEETLGRPESIYCDPPGSGENCMLHKHFMEDGGEYVKGSGTLVFEPDIRKCTGGAFVNSGALFLTLAVVLLRTGNLMSVIQ